MLGPNELYCHLDFVNSRRRRRPRGPLPDARGLILVPAAVLHQHMSLRLSCMFTLLSPCYILLPFFQLRRVVPIVLPSARLFADIALVHPLPLSFAYSTCLLLLLSVFSTTQCSKERFIKDKQRLGDVGLHSANHIQYAQKHSSWKCVISKSESSRSP